MSKQIVSTDKLAPAVGPFSAALVSNGVLYSSGQVALDPDTAKLTGEDVAAQTHRVLKNIQIVLQAAGKSLADIVKTTVYLADMREFAAMNAVYAEYFKEPYPARTTTQAAALPLGALVEIDVIAA